MIVKIHNTERGLLIAIADDELIGKKFEKGKLQLDLTSDFYKGKHMKEKEILELIEKAYILNIVGENSVKFAIKNKLIKEENILKVAKVPHAQCLFLKQNADDE